VPPTDWADAGAGASVIAATRATDANPASAVPTSKLGG
jgi:hypothetical protein